MKRLMHFPKLNIREHLRSRRQKPKTSLKKKILRGSVASLTGASILTAGLFPASSDLMQQQTIDRLDSEAAVEIMLDEPEPGDEEITEDDSASTPSKKGLFHRMRQRIRNFFLGLPQPVKACVCIPLWAAGHGILYLCSLLFSTILAPAISHILGLLLIAAVMLAVFTVTMKCLFPHMPLRKILSKRNILIILAVSVLLKAADLILPLFWDAYPRFKYPALLLAGLLFFAILFRRILKRRKKAGQTDDLQTQLPSEVPSRTVMQYYYEDTLLLESDSGQNRTSAVNK